MTEPDFQGTGIYMPLPSIHDEGQNSFYLQDKKAGSTFQTRPKGLWNISPKTKVYLAIVIPLGLMIAAGVFLLGHYGLLGHGYSQLCTTFPRFNHIMHIINYSLCDMKWFEATAIASGVALSALHVIYFIYISKKERDSSILYEINHLLQP